MVISRGSHGGLEEFVRFVWLDHGETPVCDAELRMPTGDLDLIIDLGEEQTVVSGPSTRPFLLGTAERREVMGAVFSVGGAAALLGVPLAELRDCRVPLAELWGSVASELLERSLAASSAEAKLDALESVLSARLGLLPIVLIWLRAGLRPRSHATPSAAGSPSSPKPSGFSARRLEQVFHTEVGLTPKAYQRLHRFRRGLVGIDRAAEIGWARFALERGYYDQSHFIGEFRAHSGLTPSEYVASRGSELNHVPIAA